MKKAKQTFILVSVLGCLLTVCFPLLLFPIRYKIYSEQMAKLSQMPIFDEEIIMFQMTSEEMLSLEWTKPNKEFVYDGEMYDIHSIQSEGLIKKIFVIKDTKETQLRRKLFKKTQLSIVWTSIGLYFQTYPPVIITNPIQESYKIKSSNQNVNSSTLLVFDKPPQLQETFKKT